MLVLMYHGVVSNGSDAPLYREAGADLYDLPLESFSGQMEFLMNEGYRVTTIDKAEKDNAKNIVLTFDDGEINNYTRAWPVLKKYKFPAYFFCTVNRIGKPGYMSWKELNDLCFAGWDIGSHGLNHEILTKLSADQLKKELEDSKSLLEQHLKVRIDYFSVPRGFISQAVIDIAQQCGYKKIFISGSDKKLDSFCVGRLAVKSNWTIKRFEQALNGETPTGESVFSFLKNTTKKILGTEGYDRFRGKFLRKS